ncbi:MAG TPA: branched-chain amino acid ABC transporter permease [Clostridiales bacterium]|nr:branched-chain amino acid ABC transporter permease [Clostridiales bacterium]
MNIFLQCVINGVALGAVYTIMALSYTILFGTLRIANFAQGDIYMIGMLLGFTFYVTASMNFFVGLILAIIITVLVLLIIDRLIYRPILRTSSMYLFIATIGMATFLRNASQLVFGSESYSFPHLLGSKPLQITEEISIVPQNLIIIGVCIVLVIVLFLFMRKTKTGLAMSAVSMNPFAAALMGVNYSKITTITYAISAAMASIAGVFTAPMYNVNTTVGASLGLKALIAAVMGGFGNSVGAIVGGMILGLVEALGSTYISSAYKDAFAFILLLIILFLRPQGILGRKRITKV